MQETTRTKLQSPRDAPLISGTDRESFNLMSLKIGDEKKWQGRDITVRKD
jgi:hypothetical protein